MSLTTANSRIRAFSRTFVLVPATPSAGLGSSAWPVRIVSDELTLGGSVLGDRLHQLTPSETLLLSAHPQRAVATSFSVATGLNAEWALRCLEDNGWDEVKALKAFGVLEKSRVLERSAFHRAL